MVPDKFNMVDMGGIDLIMVQGEEVPGLYNRLVESITQCHYQCLYNWFFDGIVIPPTYVIMEVNEDDEVVINEGVTVSSDDVVHIYSIVPPAPEPEIIPLLAEENGAYNVPSGKDGFNPVTVNVPSYTPVIDPIIITENGTYNAPVGVDGYSPVTVNVSGGGSSLPAEYQEVEYIDFTGTQFFSVPADFTTTAKPVLYTKSTLTNDSGSSEMCIIGNGEAGSSSTRPEIYYSSKRIYVNQASVGSLYITRTSSGDLDADNTNSSTVPVGAMVETLTEYGTNITATVLNVGKYSNGYPFMFTGRLYRAWFGNDTGSTPGSYFTFDYITRLFDLVPCYRKSDSEPGFYDVINNVFYTNAGSGTFVVGPEVN